MVLQTEEPMRTLTLALTTLLATSAMAATLEEKIDRTFDAKPGMRVVLSNTNGSVKVGSWDQPKVRIEALKEVKGRGDEAREVMSRLKVEISERSGDLVIDTKHPRSHDWGFIDFLFGNHVHANVQYTLTVPRNMDLDLETVNGRISVADVAGSLKVETTNGKIEAARCSGSVDAETTNGAIHAELVTVTPGRTMKFETTNGRISLVVPNSIGADIDASTTNGSINSEIPIATRSVSRNSLRGTLNGGGPQVRLRTTNGGINIRTSPGETK
jgi:DUF4097 and DUF4098 domain-containing protein YvlB